MSADDCRSARESSDDYPFRRRDALIQRSCQGHTVHGHDVDEFTLSQERVPHLVEFAAAPFK